MLLKRYKWICLLAAIITIELVVLLFQYQGEIEDWVAAQPSVSAYLKRVYPLLKPQQANLHLLDQLNYFEPPYPHLSYSIYRPNTDQLPQLGDLICLPWMDCYYSSNHHIVGSVYLNEYDPKRLNAYRYAKGYPSNSEVEVYHNGWYEEPGHYYYVFKGSGVFLNVGRTLVAANKVAALSVLGVTNADIFKLANHFRNRFNRQTLLYVYVRQYAQDKHISFKQALDAVIASCIKGDNYANNRIANSDGYDFMLWSRGKKLGYDTIQMPVQPNGAGGWAFELLDLRADINHSLEEQWQHEAAFLSLRNPLDLSVHAPCRYTVPFNKLYCEKS